MAHRGGVGGGVDCGGVDGCGGEKLFRAGAKKLFTAEGPRATSHAQPAYRKSKANSKTGQEVVHRALAGEDQGCQGCS